MSHDDGFVRETRASLTRLTNGLVELERATSRDQVDELFRTAHTLKGNCSMAGLDGASDLAHAVEDFLSALRAGSVRPTPELVDAALAAADDIEAIVDEWEAEDAVRTDPDGSVRRLRDAMREFRRESDAGREAPPWADDDTPTPADGDAGTPDDFDPSVVEALGSASEFDDLEGMLDEMDDPETDAPGGPSGWGTFDESASEQSPAPGGATDFDEIKRDVQSDDDISDLDEDLVGVEFGEFDDDDDMSIQDLVAGELPDEDPLADADRSAPTPAGDLDGGTDDEGTAGGDAIDFTELGGAPGEATDVGPADSASDEPGAVEAMDAPDTAAGGGASEPETDGADADGTVAAGDAPAQADPFESADVVDPARRSDPGTDTSTEDEPAETADAVAFDFPTEDAIEGDDSPADVAFDLPDGFSMDDLDPEGLSELGPEPEPEPEPGEVVDAESGDVFDAEPGEVVDAEPGSDATPVSFDDADADPITGALDAEDATEETSASTSPAESVPPESDPETGDFDLSVDAGSDESETEAALDTAATETEGGVDSADVDLPDVDLPDLDAADVDLSDVDLSDLDSADVDTSGPASGSDLTFDRDEHTVEFESRFAERFGGGSDDDVPLVQSAATTIEDSTLDAARFQSSRPADYSLSAGADTEVEHVGSLTVDVESADTLLNLVEELSLTGLRLTQADAEDGDIGDHLSDLESVTADLRRTVMDLRLMPLSTVTDGLPRVARDVARSGDKRVAFEVDDEGVRLDRSIVEKLRDPLVHLVRNAVDHGIEPPEARERAGKPAEGTVELRAWRDRDRVVIEVDDDGRGVSAERVRQQAVDSGIVSRGRAEAMPLDDVYDLVFEPGFSTASEVTDVSGRGVGMDAVRRTVTSLDGTVSLESEPDAGTTVRMRLPVSVAVSKLLFVGVGDERYAVPASVVDGVEPLDESALTDDGRVAVEWSEEGTDGPDYLPLVSLREAFGVGSAATTDGTSAGVADGGTTVDDGASEATGEEASVAEGETPSATTDGGVVVRITPDTRELALRCDEVDDAREVVVKPYEKLLGDVPGISGATMGGDGTLVNIIDVATL